MFCHEILRWWPILKAIFNLECPSCVFLMFFVSFEQQIWGKNVVLSVCLGRFGVVLGNVIFLGAYIVAVCVDLSKVCLFFNYILLFLSRDLEVVAHLEGHLQS